MQAKGTATFNSFVQHVPGHCRATNDAMDMLRYCGKMLLEMLPYDNEALYRFCRKYADRYTGDNNGDMRVNGELRLLQKMLPGAQVVFDVGANVGEWVGAALSINPVAGYHCFEPSATTWRALVDGGLPVNVRANNFGLGKEESLVPLFVFHANAGTNSLYKREGITGEQLQQETVRITSMDKYCEEESIAHVDFVKLDVEGHELAVLQGAHRMLSESRIAAIQFEYGGSNIDARVLLKDIYDFVKRVNPNYLLHKLFPDGPRPVPEYRQTQETFQYSNWVICLR